MTKVAIVIGQGSIGQRHVAVLQELGYRVAAVSRRQSASDGFLSPREAVAALRPDYAVVANATSAHWDTLRELAETGFEGRVLVEKPLAERPVPPATWPFARLGIGYNLRFHPLISRLVEALRGRDVLAARFHVGQNLSSWRPGLDFRQSSSAFRALGGGVLRDLSHELDLLMWLLGPWRRVTGLGGNLGALGIESDELWQLLFEMESGAVATVSMNYLDVPTERRIRINTRDRTIEADFMTSTLTVDGERTEVPSERNDSYKAQHLGMFADDDRICSFAAAREVMVTIDAVERAAAERIWVAR